MVEIDFYYLLKDDTTLKTLLGSSASDSRIYPIQSPEGATTPFIVYKVIDNTTLDENILQAVIQFDCISDSYDTAKSIRDRVQELIDVHNDITYSIPYGYFDYKHATIDTSYNYKEPILDIFHYLASFAITYIDYYGFLLQENTFYLLQENGFNFRIV
jgi:hypothetical protein